MPSVSSKLPTSDPPELEDELLEELELDDDEFELLELEDELDELDDEEFDELLLDEELLDDELLDEELEEPVPPEDVPLPPQAASAKLSAPALISFARRCWCMDLRSKVIIFPVVRLFMTICRPATISRAFSPRLRPN